MHTLVGALIQESDESSRQAILQSLFARRDGMDRYLDLVLNASTRRVAIESLQTAPGESRQMLLTALDGPSIQRRFATARALGSICGGDTLPVLRSMISAAITHARRWRCSANATIPPQPIL